MASGKIFNKRRIHSDIAIGASLDGSRDEGVVYVYYGEHPGLKGCWMVLQ